MNYLARDVKSFRAPKLWPSIIVAALIVMAASLTGCDDHVFVGEDEWQTAQSACENAGHGNALAFDRPNSPQYNNVNISVSCFDGSIVHTQTPPPKLCPAKECWDK